MSPNLENVIEFLTMLFNKGLQYSALNSARSALSTVIIVQGKPVGQHPIIIRFLKGVYNLRPTFPKTNVTWDPEILLKFMKTLSPVRLLSLKNLTLKTTALLWLLTGQRGQSIQCIDIRNLTLNKNILKIRFGDTLKTSKPGCQQNELNIRAYAPDRRLCVITVLTEYIKRTKVIRQGVTQLLISTQKPHDGVSRDTISRWIKFVMAKAGLNVSIFTPHSVRGASTSAAFRAQVPLDTILATAGWGKDNTFRKYYNKPIKRGNAEFATKILENCAGGT